MTGEERELFESVTKLKADLLLPKLWVNYTRLTFVSRKLDERLTIDLNLSFSEGIILDKKRSKAFSNLVIAEVKQKKVSFSSPFIRLMANRHTRKLSLSKYCLGISMLHPDIKQNLFKSKILTVKKIMHGLN